MATWLSLDEYKDQVVGNEQLEYPAPNPADNPETREESTSFWIREHEIDFEKNCMSAALPDEVDIVIIGSGITGAATAYHISQNDPSLRVAVLEARGICTGATGRNGGHIIRPEVYHLRQLADMFDVQEAIRLRTFSIKNRDMVLDCIQKLDIADKVDLQLNGCIAIFESEEERAKFAGDLQFAKENGMNPECYLLSTEETIQKLQIEPSRAQFGAAFIQRGGTFYPRKFVNELFRAAMDNMPALSIHPYTPVRRVSQPSTSTDGNTSYSIHTDKGTLKARAVFHATNAWANNLVPSLLAKSGVFGCKAHVVAVQPNKPNLPPSLKHSIGYADFWHWLAPRVSNGPIIYGYSTYEVVGDYNDTITLDPDSPVRQDMVQFLETTFPDYFENIDISKDFKYDWTGIQGFTSNGASIVGRPNPESMGEFASVGHNGEGMGRCFLCAAEATKFMLEWLKNGKAATYTPPEWFPRSYLRNVLSK